MNQTEQNHQINNKISVLGANTIFLVGIAVLFGLDLFITVSKIKIDMVGLPIIAIEVLFFLVPSFLYILISKRNIKEVLRLNKLSIGNGFIVVAIMLFALPIIGYVNYFIYLLISSIGRPIPNPLPDINNFNELLSGIIVIAVSPAICEEVMARGVIMRGYERFGKKTALVVSALLFSLMHRNIQSLVSIFIIGLILGYVVYRTNSIFAGMIVHFINNSFAVIATFFVKKFQEMMGVPMQELENVKVPAMNLPGLIIAVVVIIFFTAALVGWIVLLRHNTQGIVEKHGIVKREDITPVRTSSYIPLIIGMLFIIAYYILQMYYILSIPLPNWLSFI